MRRSVLLGGGVAAGCVLLGGVLLAGPALAGPAGRAADPVSAGRVGLSWQLASTRPDFAVGEPVRLVGTVTNLGAAACGLADLSDGTLRIVAVRRDGRPLTPEFGRGGYPDGLASAVAARVQAVQGGGRFEVGVSTARSPAGGAVLRAVEPTPDGAGLVAQWAVSAPGRYEVTAVYAMPQVTARGLAACEGAAGPVTVAFAVGEPGLRGSRWVLGAVVLGAAAGLGALVYALRRRRPRMAGLLVVLAVAGLASTPRTARAAYSVDDAPAGFRAAVAACLERFAAPGADPAGVLPELTDPGAPAVRIVPAFWETATFAGTAGTGPSTVEWDPVGTRPYRDGVPREPCTALYHALVEATGAPVPAGACGTSGIATSAVVATLAENQYRSAAGLPVRGGYGGHRLPAGTAACGRRPAPGQVCAGGCARDGGDPHLTTFDQYPYDLQAVGEFVLAGGPAGFAVQARQAPLAGSRSVALTTAVAARVGADRVTFRLAGGIVQVRVGGLPVNLPRGPYPLPGGGRLIRRAGIGTGPDGYALVWPDGSAAQIDAMGPWSLRLYLRPAPALAGRLRGLLGDFDGKPANDLTTRAGVVLPHRAGGQPDFGRLYPGYADQWRVSAAQSLFDYPLGQNAAQGTAAATDRGFPDHAAGADLAPEPHARAEALCRTAGVTDQWLLADCAQDVSLSGQPAFAVAAADTERATGSAHAASPVLGVLRDGDRVGPDEPYPGAGWLGGPTERDSYDVDVPAGASFELYDMQGAQSGVRVDLLDAAGRPVVGRPALPGAHGFRVPAGPGRYRLQVSAPLSGGGRYAFRLVVLKPRTYDMHWGQRLDGRLDVPGRVDRYAFRSAGMRSVVLSAPAGGARCRRVWLGLVDDRGVVSGPVQPCLPVTLPIADPGRDYAVLVWAGNGDPADYAFTATPH